MAREFVSPSWRRPVFSEIVLEVQIGMLVRLVVDTL